MDTVGEVVGHEAYGQLTLAVRLLVDRCGDGPILKIGRHFREEVGGDQFYFSGQALRFQDTANRQAIDGIYVDTSEAGDTAKEFRSLLEAFGLIFVPFNHADNLAAGTVARKGLRKAIGFLAVVFGSEHACDDRNL